MTNTRKPSRPRMPLRRPMPHAATGAGTWVRVELTFACAAVLVDASHRIAHAAPIFAGWNGKTFRTLLDYYAQKNQLVGCSTL